jgi:hypothetical protein
VEFRLGSASDMPFEDSRFDFLLCRAATLESVYEEVGRMGSGYFMLLKRAYTRSDFEELLRQRNFGSVEIEEHGIAMDIWLQK